MDELRTDLARAEAFQNLLLSFATGGGGDDAQYRLLRQSLVENADLAQVVPSWVRTLRDLGQFWAFIKSKFGSYAERRKFIWDEMRPLFEHLEGKSKHPADDGISESLLTFDKVGVHAVWARALERRSTDPEGAITIARTLLETVCKHILDRRGVQYDPDRVDLPELYRLTSTELILAPSQHTQDTFKKILGGVTSVVNELGSLRNRLSDAHGKGRRLVKPSARHAALAVNLAGSIAMFLVETFAANSRELDAPEQ